MQGTVGGRPGSTGRSVRVRFPSCSHSATWSLPSGPARLAPPGGGRPRRSRGVPAGTASPNGRRDHTRDRPMGNGRRRRSSDGCPARTLAGHATLFTALGNDELGHRPPMSSLASVSMSGGSPPGQPQRRGDRSPRSPTANDDYLAVSESGAPRVLRGGDLPRAGSCHLPAPPRGAPSLPAAAGRGRRGTGGGGVMATARAPTTLREAEVSLDALVHSDLDTGEALRGRGPRAPAGPRRRYRAECRRTLAGARREPEDGTRPSSPPGPLRDTYGCGDAFAGGLTSDSAPGSVSMLPSTSPPDAARGSRRSTAPTAAESGRSEVRSRGR